MTNHSCKLVPRVLLLLFGALVLACNHTKNAQEPDVGSVAVLRCEDPAPDIEADASVKPDIPDQVLEWNQIFIETLVATNTPNASSPRLGAIVHAAIFDAFNGIEHRYRPILVPHRALTDGASRRAAAIAAAYTAMSGLFPAQQSMFDDRYAASLASLQDDGEDAGTSRERGIAWGREVAQTVLAQRASDGFSSDHPPFDGGTAVGQWRPTPPAFGTMSALGLAFTLPFVVESESQFRPQPPRPLTSDTYIEDLRAVQSLGRSTDSTRTDEQTALAVFWDGNASVHWNEAANQIARANNLSISETTRLLAMLNIAMADTSFTIWSSKLFYASVPSDVTWRPVTSISLADTDGNPNTTPEQDWLPLITTPAHPEYPAGHPSLNGAAATVLLRYFEGRPQPFVLKTNGQPDRTYASITQAREDADNARVWGGMHYPSTVRISDAVGEAIASYVLNRTQRSRLATEIANTRHAW